MVKAGNLEIMGTIDTAQIDAGLDRMRGSLQKISDSTKPVETDLIRMSGVLGKMSLAFVGLATAGAFGLSRLSRDAPVLADEFARVDVAIGKIKRDLGKEFEPAAKAVAAATEGLANFVSKTAGSGIISGAVAGAGIGATVGGIAGTVIGGPFGGVVGALGGGAIGGLYGAGIGAGVIPNPLDIRNQFGILGKLVGATGFLSRESDRKFNLFNIWDSVFG